MGGLSCLIPRNAIMAGMTPPIQPANAADQVYVSQCNAFDEKLRRLYAQSDVVAGIVDADLAEATCAILAKPTWSPEDRDMLWSALNSLWPSKYGP